MRTVLAISVISSLCISLLSISLYHQWVKTQPIARELIKIATCDRSLLIHQEAVRLAKLNLPEEERKKEMRNFVIKYHKVTSAHGELIFDPHPQGPKVLDLTAQIKKEIESIDWH